MADSTLPRARLLSRSVTFDLRGLTGTWQCSFSDCLYAKNSYDTMFRTLTPSCDGCNRDHFMNLDEDKVQRRLFKKDLT